MPNANSFIADELAYKTKYLQYALDQAKDIILKLETENNRLKDALINLAFINNEDLANTLEESDDRLCAV